MINKKVGTEEGGGRRDEGSEEGRVGERGVYNVHQQKFYIKRPYASILIHK